MIEPSEAKQIQQDYFEILKTILDRIRAKASAQGFKPDDSISIQIGRNVVYKQDGAGNLIRNNINKEDVELLNKALSDPRSIKGSIQIKIGKEVVYKVSNGEVLQDRLKLAPAQVETLANKEYQDIFEETHQKVHQQVKSLQELEDRIEEKSFSINSITINNNYDKEIEKLQQDLSLLKQKSQSQQEAIEKFQQNLKTVLAQKIPVAKKSVLQIWTAKFQDKARNVIDDLWDKVKDTLNPDEVLSREEGTHESIKFGSLNTKLTSLNTKHINQEGCPIFEDHSTGSLQMNGRQAPTKLRGERRLPSSPDKIRDAKFQERIDALALKVDEFGAQVKELKRQKILHSKTPSIKKAIGTLLHLEGDRNDDGSISLEAEDFSIKQLGSSILVKATDGRELMKDGQLTNQVTEQDLANFEEIVSGVNKYLEDSLSTSQAQFHSHSQRPGR